MGVGWQTVGHDTITPDCVSILFLSDIHLGHRKVPASELISSCWDIIRRATNIDGIVFPGDLFDRSIPLGSEAAMDAIMFVRELKVMCRDRQWSLAFLEGTERHDRAQPRVIRSVTGGAIFDATPTLTYVDEITINQYLGLWVLWVPDNMARTTDEVWAKVLKVIADNPDVTLDAVFMHGAFVWQLPYAPKEAHLEPNYINLGVGFVVSGHHHVPDSYPSDDPVILIPGSVGRIKHGEEHPKGGLVIRLDPVLRTRAHFRIYNSTATVFLTVNTNDMSLSEVSDEISKHCIGTATPHIRLQGLVTDTPIMNLTSLRLKLPMANILVDVVSAPVPATVRAPKADPTFLGRDSLGPALVDRISETVAASDLAALTTIIRDALL